MPKTANVLVSDEVKDILQRSTLDGFNLYLPAALGDKYKEVDKVLRLAGACWDRRQPMGPSGIKGAHVVMAQTMENLEIALQDGKIVDVKKTHQQFFTPPEVAREIVLRCLQQPRLNAPAQRYLEPSAGEGAFADELARVLLSCNTMREANNSLLRTQTLPPHKLVCVDIDPVMVAKLRAKGHQAHEADFLKLKPKLSNLFDHIFMNPPFSAGQDMLHVMHAFKFLKPDGKLTSIMSVGAGGGSSQLNRNFRDFVVSWGEIIMDLPEGTFKQSGTNVATIVYEFTAPDF